MDFKNTRSALAYNGGLFDMVNGRLCLGYGWQMIFKWRPREYRKRKVDQLTLVKPEQSIFF